MLLNGNPMPQSVQCVLVYLFKRLDQLKEYKKGICLKMTITLNTTEQYPKWSVAYDLNYTCFRGWLITSIFLVYLSSQFLFCLFFPQLQLSAPQVSFFRSVLPSLHGNVYSEGKPQRKAVPICSEVPPTRIQHQQKQCPPTQCLSFILAGT